VRTEIVKERNFVWLHFIKACGVKMKEIASPTVYLSRSRPPKNLVKHDIGLGVTQLKFCSTLDPEVLIHTI